MVVERAMVVSEPLRENLPEGVKLPGLRNKVANLPAIMRGEAAQSDYVPHLSRGDVQLMATVAAGDTRHGRRDATLIRTVYDSALRISEALAIRYVDLVQTPDGWTVAISTASKTGAAVAAISAGTVMELRALCYELHRAPTDKIFGISRSQAYRIIVSAYEKSGVRRASVKVDGVGAVHILRHTGALARLKASGNPRSVQAQLRHKSAAMTMRYLRTQQQDESIAMQQQVDATW
jgi:integrase